MSSVGSVGVPLVLTVAVPCAAFVVIVIAVAEGPSKPNVSFVITAMLIGVSSSVVCVLNVAIGLFGNTVIVKVACVQRLDKSQTSYVKTTTPVKPVVGVNVKVPSWLKIIVPCVGVGGVNNV